MITSYKDLSSEETQKIVKKYCLEDNTAVEASKEIAFVLAYRENLYDALKLFWDANVSNREENEKSARALLQNIASNLHDYMHNLSGKNIMQRIHFVNSIEEEVQCIHNTIQWVLHKYSSENSITMNAVDKEVCDFLKYVCSREIVNNIHFDRMIEENSYFESVKLKNELKQQFVSYIDPKNLTFYDIYFLIGECLQKIADSEEKQDVLERTRCEGCQTDDCQVSHCNVYNAIVDFEATQKKYRKILNLCIARLNDKQVSASDILLACKGVSDNEDLVEIIKKLMVLPSVETRNDKIKKVEVDDLTETPQLINEQLVMKLLTENIMMQDSEYYENLDLITTSLLVSRCDYRNAKGAKQLESFKNWYKEFILKKESAFALSRLGQISILIEEYDKKYNINKCSGELGGE